MFGFRRKRWLQGLGATANTGLITKGVTTGADGQPAPTTTAVQVSDTGEEIHWASPSPLTMWPYKGTPGEKVLELVIGTTLDATATTGASAPTYYSMEFPLHTSSFPLSGIAPALANTLVASLYQRSNAFAQNFGDETNLIWGGISLLGSELVPQTVDGGHPVPIWSGLISKPDFTNPMSGDQGYPLFIFQWPDGSDTNWGVYITAQSFVPAGSDDQYTVQGNTRLQARGLGIAIRPLPDPLASQQSVSSRPDAQQPYQGKPCFPGYDPKGECGAFHWITAAADAIWGAIVTVIEDVVSLTKALCDPLLIVAGKIPAAQAAAACGLGGPPIITCPPGTVINPATGQCAPDTLSQYLPFIIIGGGLILLILMSDKKKSPSGESKTG